MYVTVCVCMCLCVCCVICMKIKHYAVTGFLHLHQLPDTSCDRSLSVASVLVVVVVVLSIIKQDTAWYRCTYTFATAHTPPTHTHAHEINVRCRYVEMLQEATAKLATDTANRVATGTSLSPHAIPLPPLAPHTFT